jgi:hypothetical protein
MGKVIGILMFVVAMWTSVEVYNKGSANAFGGLLTKVGWVEPAPESAAPTSAGRRVGKAVIGAHDEADARRERLLAE